jgi:hypothetical protein
MGTHRKTTACLIAAVAAALCGIPAGCSAPERAAPPSRDAAMAPPAGTDPQELQSTVMSMSDDWNTALGESMVAIQSASGIGMETRINGLAFLRNGMGASLDIAVGPNPRVSMLDLLVLAALQEWALEHTWAGHGIPPGLVGPAKARLTEARREMASKASRHLTETQLRELDRLVAAWIQAHPRQVLVSFVRLSDFGSDRNELTLEDRRLANGLLKEVDQVTSAIDDARLLGERALWYAARYPFVVGQQAELTSMRVTKLVAEEAAAQREAIFARFAEERERTLRMIETSRNDLVPVLAEARQTIAAASALSEQLRGVVVAVDGLVARFDHPEGDDGGLTAQDIKDILREAGESADKLSALVKASDALVQSPAVGEATAGAGRIGTAAIDRLLWGSAGIVALLVGGLALVRLVPQRVQRG